MLKPFFSSFHNRVFFVDRAAKVLLKYQVCFVWRALRLAVENSALSATSRSFAVAEACFLVLRCAAVRVLPSYGDRADQPVPPVPHVHHQDKSSHSE